MCVIRHKWANWISVKYCENGPNIRSGERERENLIREEKIVFEKFTVGSSTAFTPQKTGSIL